MVVETVMYMYIKGIELQNNIDNEELRVTKVISTDFTRLEDIQNIIEVVRVKNEALKSLFIKVVGEGVETRVVHNVLD